MMKGIDPKHILAIVRKDTPGSQVKVHFNNAGKKILSMPALANMGIA